MTIPEILIPLVIVAGLLGCAVAFGRWLFNDPDDWR